jgi:hypothetical protein
VSLFETALKYPVCEVKEISEKFHLEGQRTLGLALAAVDEAVQRANLEDDISKYRME